MVYALLLALTLVAGCSSGPEDQASKPQARPEVAAIRGGEGPAAPPPSNAFANAISEEVAAMNRAKAVAADANHKIARDQANAESAGR